MKIELEMDIHSRGGLEPCKRKVTIEEAVEDSTIYDFLEEIITPLLICMGYSKQTVHDGYASYAERDNEQ